MVSTLNGQMTDILSTRLVRWKQKLIDQTLHNPLLNFKPSKLTTISVVDEKPSEVFNTLQIQGRSMTFKPAAEGRPGAKRSSVEFSLHDQKPSNAGHLDLELQTGLTAEILNLHLLRIFQKSASLFEEQGFSSLCLSLGMLEWFDAKDGGTLLKAPMVLLPVQLERETAGSKFTLKATQDDPVLNPAIMEKLRTSHRFQLPPLPDSFEDFQPMTYFAMFQQAIEQQQNWRVTEDIFLSFFAFQKFVMYRDLEIAEDIYAQHEIVQALATGKAEKFAGVDSDDDEHLDQVLKPETTFQVLDADSSQQQAIVAVRSGKNLVIEGPPGTGKSQTITNIIAEVLADGKTVLFVSEKIAALEVVYNRLESAGLKDFCLELHSKGTSKKSVYQELQRALDNCRPHDHAEDGDLTRLSLLRSFLNDYAQALHHPFGILNITPFKAIGEISLLENAPVVNVVFDEISNCQMETFLESCRSLKHHAKLVSEIGPIDTHPWRGSELTKLSAEEQDQLYELINNADSLLNKLQIKSEKLAVELGAVCPSTFAQLEILCEIGTSLVRSPGTSEGLLLNASWNSISPEVATLIDRGEHYTGTLSAVTRCFREEFLELDFEPCFISHKEKVAKWYRHLMVSYWKERVFFQKRYDQNYKPNSLEQLLSDLEIALQCRQSMLHVIQQNRLGHDLFGDKWKGPQSSWDELREFANWIVTVRRFILEDALKPQGIALAASGTKQKDSVEKSVLEIRDLTDSLRVNLSEICDRAKFEIGRDNIVGPNANLIDLAQRLESMNHGIRRIHEWIAYNLSVQVCKTSFAGSFFDRFNEQNLDVCQLESSFRRSFLRRWLDMAFDERPILARFQPIRHEEFITEFRRLDSRSLELAKQRLRHNVSQRRDQLLKTKSFEDELRILQRQMRTRSKLPLRKLFRQVPSVIRAIKPCFMMSPISAAQFLNPSSTPFDVVIFDEASQITVEDALGAIVRGRQLIVVGDPKQLPPTDFFVGQAIDEVSSDENEELQIADLESVLDECIAAAFPIRKLKWHYRSRHESLIAFSNKKFYDSELLTFPGPDTGVAERGLTFEFVAGTYEGAGVNPKEAAAIADAVCHHARRTPHLSLGVGTFNVKQMILIKDEIDRRRREDPSLEFFFAKKGEGEFFVKNLETIQGDDRDVIFLSVTYGPGADGKVRYNFGPINGQNGWRRLNVILTRSKLRMRVFSSMRAEDIDLARATNDGAKYLRDFLYYAERETSIALECDQKILTPTPFEQAVYDELTKKGLRLIPKVGQAGYKVDFGVLDEDFPGRFVVGIECDGATYQSAATARDRDRLRQQVLEGLGWHLIRIWSTDWFHNRDTQIARVVEFVSKAKESLQDSLNQEPEPIIDFTPLKEESRPQANEGKTATIDQSATGTATVDHSTAATATIDQPAAATENMDPYSITPVEIMGDAQAFNEETDQRIESIVQRVLDHEAPIHVDELKKRVAAHWQISRIGNRISARLDAIIISLLKAKLAFCRGEFIWREEPNAIAPRCRRSVEGYSFSTETIPPEELDQCISMILRDKKGRTKEEIITDVTRSMGFRRAGQKLSDSISQRIQRMMDQSLLEPCSAGLRLPINR
ncbi:MAG: DUF3320 domain-containing protein [Candidatus Melainabacteria bacterium]|nr:DUF3320 domain-containing protein [Candidatus Melainabacteria bacterium]